MEEGCRKKKYNAFREQWKENADTMVELCRNTTLIDEQLGINIWTMLQETLDSDRILYSNIDPAWDRYMLAKALYIPTIKLFCFGVRIRILALANVRGCK